MFCGDLLRLGCAAWWPMAEAQGPSNHCGRLVSPTAGFFRWLNARMDTGIRAETVGNRAQRARCVGSPALRWGREAERFRPVPGQNRDASRI
jgi:hypothetical protein